MAEPFHAWPDITIDGTPLSAQNGQQLDQVIVDHHQHLPDMFEISFHDPGKDILSQAGAKIGSTVVIKVTPPGGSSAETLINGEITSLEAKYHTHRTQSVIRGYDKSHRLHRGRRTETYKNVTDSDVARKVAQRAGLTIGQIDSTSGTFELVSQANQSDWDFLKARAREIGYEMAMEDGKFSFRQPKEASSAPQNGDYQNHSDPLQLVSGDDLIELHVRVTSAEQVNDVKVRGWDPDQKQAVIGSANAGTVAVDSLPDDSPSLANTFGGPTFTAVNRPLAKQPEVDAAAKAIAEAISSAYAEADGIALGNPKLTAGSTVSLGVVGDEFAGKYTLTSARHVFADGGYRTHFAINGRQDRTLLGLASLGTSNGHASAGGAPINGVVVALVTDNNDPNNGARVKLKFPWLDDSYESDWARLAQLGAGPNSGALWIPEVNDEVLVAFEHGDIRRPYVVGQLYNGKDTPNLGSGLFDNGKVKRRGFISRKGHKLLFFDDDSKKGIAIISDDGKFEISLNETSKEIHIKSGGKVMVKSDQDMNFESGANLTIKASSNITVKASGQMDIESSGTATVKGAQLKLTGDSQVAVDGMFAVNNTALVVSK
ncbi:MAG TPA: VgrG-related protein [Candidatus Acidoferrum sp.]|nr:VgrG-related protein [Candidatus Acidoferrum sp.]